jgi:hypothetical protein
MWSQVATAFKDNPVSASHPPALSELLHFRLCLLQHLPYTDCLHFVLMLTSRSICCSS